MMYASLDVAQATRCQGNPCKSRQSRVGAGSRSRHLATPTAWIPMTKRECCVYAGGPIRPVNAEGPVQTVVPGNCKFCLVQHYGEAFASIKNHKTRLTLLQKSGISSARRDL